MPLTTPIVVAEGMDVGLYASEEAVDRRLEPWFADEDYRAFDAEGRKLVLRVERRAEPRRWLPGSVSREQIVVESTEEEPAHSEELADLLREWLSLVDAGATAPARDASLSELVKRAIERGHLYS